METKQKSIERNTGAVHKEFEGRTDAFKNAVRGAVVGVAVAISAAGCATYQQNGQVLGGVLGGVLGSQIGQGTGRAAATIIGTLAGAYIGGSIGQSMDRQDQMMAAHAIVYNPNGRASTWTNPNNGNSYQVTPLNTYTPNAGPNAGQLCRQYMTTGVINGKAEKIEGTACRQPDGSWKIQ